jgi:hypothetical protein
MAENNEFAMQEFKFPHELEEDKNVSVSAEEDRIEIEIDDDTPEQDRGVKPMPKEIVQKLEEDELDKYSAEAKEKLAQLKKVWHDERREKEAALREQQEAVRVAQQLLNENKKLKHAYSTGEREYISTVQGAVELQLEVAKRNYKESLETGDSERIAEAQLKMNEASFRSQQAKNFRPTALQEDENEVQIPQMQQKAVTPDAKTQEWTEKNPWFGAKKSMTAYALGLHEELIDEYGTNYAGTDQYFHRIDKEMRKVFSGYFDDSEPQTKVDVEEESKPSQKSKPSTVVASATRSTSSKQIRLKPSQIALARKLGLSPEQYARELIKMEARNG